MYIRDYASFLSISGYKKAGLAQDSALVGSLRLKAAWLMLASFSGSGW